MKGWYAIKAASDGTSANISIYEEIGGWGITAQQFSEDLKALGDISHISLHIHSPGGDVFDGISYGADRRSGRLNGVSYCDGRRPNRYAGKRPHDDPQAVGNLWR